MRVTVIKSVFAALLAGAFLAGSMMCCCIRHLIQEKASSSCCHKSAKADPAKCADGCSSIIKSAANTKVFDLVPPAVMAAPMMVQDVLPLSRPALIQPAFYRGPPGPVSAVPLYIQSRSLRI